VTAVGSVSLGDAKLESTKEGPCHRGLYKSWALRKEPVIETSPVRFDRKSATPASVMPVTAVLAGRDENENV